MAEKASPASGGEFLLQLLRHPPRSQPPESPSHAAVIDDRRNQFEDAAIVEVGNGIAFSPPNLAAPGMMPPWLFPSPQPHHNTRSPPPGFHSRPEQRQQGGGSEGGYGRGSNLQNHHHHHHRQQQQQQQQKKNFRDEATPTPTHLGFTTGVSDSAANFGSRDAKTDLSAFPGWGQVEVSRKMMVTEQDRRLANGKLADANWKTNHSRDHRGKGLLSPPVSNEWAGDASSAARRTTVDHGRSSKGTWNMQKDYPRVPNVEDFPKEDNPMILPSPYVNKPTMQKKFYQHTNLERAKHFVENGRNRASEPRADFLDDLHRTNIDQDFVSRGFSTFSLKQLPDSFTVVEEHPEKIEVQVNCSRSKDYRSDFSRGHNVSNQRRRINRGAMQCRRDIRNLSSSFCSIYGSLLPRKDESAKQMQLLSLLKKLVGKEWPDARLHLYGSCANSFGVTTSDIDICLAIDDTMTSKPEILLRLADILQTDNLQNVQALTRARVPIVKVMDPVSGISCDICINNLLAVENTKLLRDYAQIDSRLQQLVFLVKHWAKSRNVNETYQGTLSSYAYVLMCIHFLQQRRPAILPCLQKMEPTYVTTVDGVRCAYFDNVEKLQNFGSSNGENVAELLWGFFNYWAFQHDYTNDVISVRTGGIISKQSKDWTRRIGNDRHLICIEDPFETSHDLGRVVDKRSIRILREEFERAADLLQFDSNPCITLFEPYVR